MGLSLFAVLLSTGLDFIPGVGTIKGIYEAITGEDAITGEELEWWERTIGVVPYGGALASGVGFVRRVDKIGDAAKAGKVYKAGTPEHKAQRWKDYKEAGGTWSYERWSKNYDNNVIKPGRSNEAMNAYHQRIGWGEREVSVTINGQKRILDLADIKAQRAIEHKTRTGDGPYAGYFSAKQEIRWEIERDAMLVEDGWDITWVFEDATASEPLLQMLIDEGIKYKFIKRGGI
ncbi:pre-toxin TG domain-containing protein [Desmospora profundinema]|uniref:Pre-toxin TG domain-containing protein n=1 Tax=Desmospora profundinema TaxID=1571184 RepID=A0ABU1IRN3_9BACL|nr:pre-toxin TG domain-containing protein [Desmospora profundinema]MDR6226824.1 hypothetical protein [Desmospora profundinema]